VTDDRPSFAAISGKEFAPVPLAMFLRARLDEEAGLAGGAFRDVNDGSAPDFGMEWSAAWDLVMAGETRVLEQDPGIGDAAVAEHVAHWDPKRVLAGVLAKRAIVDLYTADQRDVPLGLQHLDDDAWVMLEWVLQQLALPYAGHPDYRPEWKP
jgi:hypothetical protein